MDPDTSNPEIFPNFEDLLEAGVTWEQETIEREQETIEREQAIQNQIAQASIIDQAFKASLKKKWKIFEKLYTEHEFLHKSKFNRFEDTALHIAISSYHPDRDDPKHHPHLNCITEMIESIPEDKRLDILKEKNEKWNTPLHLAAELGNVPVIECLVKPEVRTDLILETNSKGETPLFITAYRGHLQAFLYLHMCVQSEEVLDPIELCRRKDGDNILHAAISREYFEVAFQIIHYYPLLINRYNTKGMSPLHVLAGKPKLFSRSRFRFINSMIHFSINIEEIKPMTYKAEGEEDVKLELGRNLPENYQTLVEFVQLLWNGTRRIRDITNVNQDKMSQDTTQATDVSLEKNSPGHQSDRPYDPESPPNTDTTGATNENHEKKSPAEDRLFPPNYIIFIKFLKCLMKIVLIVLAIGFPWIKKFVERNRKCAWGVQIMKLLIQREERYKLWGSTGEKPKDRDHHSQDLAPPTEPPLIVEDDNRKDEDQSKTAATKQSPTFQISITITQDEKKKDDHKSELSTLTKETPLLVASRMGILDMVKMILKKHPIAIQDTDSDEKNILLLAAEHRQPDLYNWLMRKNYPPYVYSQVDKHGNNVRHLAAKFENLQVWRTPGSALQLQDERKWYKYVIQTWPEQSYVRYNNNGKAPQEIFRETHEKLLKDGTKWLIKTADSCSLVAALIATVAFTTAATIPGGPDNNGHPQLENQPAFNVFSISSLFSLCFSVTALVYFLAILTSRCQHDDFEKNLPRKLLIGLTSLFASIAGILVSFCAAHFFVLEDKFKKVAFLIYGVTCIPVVFFAFNQFPLYFDLISSSQKLPDRHYKGHKEFYTDSSVASSSDQKKAGKDKDD